jgi:hypothetical protein
MKVLRTCGAGFVAAGRSQYSHVGPRAQEPKPQAGSQTSVTQST